MIRFRKAKGIKSVERSYEKILSADYARDYVEVERFIECCKMCPNYGAKWGCPPYAFDVREKYWNNYKYLHLFAFKMYLEDDIIAVLRNAYDACDTAAKEQIRYVKEIYEANFPEEE